MKKMITILLAIIFLAALGFAAQTKKTTKKGVKKMEITAVIKTEKGSINLKLYPENAPLTVANFVNLVQSQTAPKAAFFS